jgi:hypothetical protein
MVIVLFGGKSGQHIHGVLADGNWATRWHSKSGLFGSTSCDAEGSPSGTAVTDNQGTPTVTGLVQVDALTVMVWQDDVREALPNCRANRGEVDAKVEGSSHKCSFREVSSRTNCRMRVRYDTRP